MNEKLELVNTLKKQMNKTFDLSINLSTKDEF